MTPTHICHIIYQLAVGGMENGLVNLVNHLPSSQFKHTIISLSDSTEFASRIHRPVSIINLNKLPGHSWKLYARIFNLLKHGNYDVVHTRNLACLEYQICAWRAGIKKRLHSEHGWEMNDVEGSNKKNQYLRKVFSPFAQSIIGLSKHTKHYLEDTIRLPADKLKQIYNGVDTKRFHPSGGDRSILPENFRDPNCFIVGSVGRLSTIKNPQMVISVFTHFAKQLRGEASQIRLAIIGDGPLYNEIKSLAANSPYADQIWLAGAQNQIAEILPLMDIFIQCSSNEGISNTLLEAMSCARPIIATAVGGNPELIETGKHGLLIADNHTEAFVEALMKLWHERTLATGYGQEARLRVEQNFSLTKMIKSYHELYQPMTGLKTCVE